MNLKTIGCLAGVVIVVIILLVGALQCNTNKQTTPDTRYMAITASRTYFSDSVSQSGGIYTLHGYYTKSGNSWVLKSRDLILTPEIFGKVTLKEGKAKK